MKPVCLLETPSQPGRPVISQVSSCDVLLLWEQPENDGNSDIINYRVDYRQSGRFIFGTGTFYFYVLWYI